MLVELVFLGVATLYSSTGHGGGSGYLALLLLVGLSPAAAAPIALTLNLFVASMALIAFHRAGGAAPRLALPIVAVSAPAAFLGGGLELGTTAVALVVGPALLIAAGLLAFRPEPKPRDVGVATLMAAGGIEGLVAGITGIGGGIYLTPLLLLAGWARKDEAAWTSALFILVNSVAGLGARALGDPSVMLGAIDYLIPVTIGGLVGSVLGSFQFSPKGFRRAMAAVLAVAAGKVLLPLFA